MNEQNKHSNIETFNLPAEREFSPESDIDHRTATGLGGAAFNNILITEVPTVESSVPVRVVPQETISVPEHLKSTVEAVDTPNADALIDSVPGMTHDESGSVAAESVADNSRRVVIGGLDEWKGGDPSRVVGYDGTVKR